MRTTTLTILTAASLMLLASACKRSEPKEPGAASEDPTAPSSEDRAAGKGEAEAPDTANEPTDTRETPEEQAPTEAEPATPARTIDAIDPGDGWSKVLVRTPRGVTVSLGVPGEWVELRPPNDATLLVRGAPIDTPAAGTKATIVATEFEGGLTQLVEDTRGRLATFAAIKSEGPLRAGAIDGYEFVASWSTPVGTKDTVQLLVSTGKEAIGVTCEVPPGQLEALSGLCDEIFATLSIKGATTKK